MKKRFFTLIEVIFFTVLSAILIGYLLNFFSHMMIVQKKSEKLENTILEEALLSTRLKKIFSSLKTPYVASEKSSSSNLLQCIYNNGIDLDPSFAKTLQADLYANAKKNLILKTYPYPSKDKKSPYREEILLENVSSLRFEFLSQDGIKKEWKFENAKKPIWIKIYYTHNDQEKCLSFITSFTDLSLPILSPG